MLKQGTLSQRQLEDASDTILRNSQLQIRLIEDLLDVSRIISGKLHLNLAAMNMSDVVQQALDAVQPAAAAKDIDLRPSLSHDAILVGDPDRLRQVAWNLLSNAVKYTPKHGRVEVRVDKKESQIHLTVSDNGMGVEPHFLPHLFERFTQADSSTTRRHGGLGLGLAIVRHLAELHGGTVSAASEGTDKGATFIVTLPIRAVAEPVDGDVKLRRTEDQSQQTVEPAVLHGIRVLVVDDEPDALTLVEAVLRQYGADVRTAGSAQEAFQEMQRWRPDVLVADIGMPVEDGYALLRRVRALSESEGGSIPAAALTAYAQDEDRQQAFVAGFQEHVAKPVPPERLAHVVARLASRSVN
jgi:CheY-like chemotaxis protein/two-component sensor histidine kinase